MEKAKKKISIGKIISNVIVTLIVALVIYLVIEIVYGFIKGLPPCIFGHYIFVVKSGSMQPTICIGDVVFVKRTSIENVNVGDVICFLDINPSDAVCGQYITHRVVAGDALNGFYTQGDNPICSQDAYAVTSSNFIGVVDGWSSFLGSVVSFFTSNTSVVFIIIIVTLLVVVGLEVKNILMLKSQAKKEEEEKEKAKQEILKEINKKKEK